MCEAEKATQVGMLAFELKGQTQELAHLTVKLERVRLAWRVFASNPERWTIDPADAMKVLLRYPEEKERGLGDYLLSQGELARLMAEISAVDQAVKQTRAKLASVGIIGL